MVCRNIHCRHIFWQSGSMYHNKTDRSQIEMQPVDRTCAWFQVMFMMISTTVNKALVPVFIGKTALKCNSKRQRTSRLLTVEVMRQSGSAAGLFPPSLPWSLDSGKLICCHLAHCPPRYLGWSGLSWASVRIQVSSTVHMGQMEDLHLQRAWKNAHCDLSYTNAAECSPSVSRKEWEDLTQTGAEILWQISDLLRRWQKSWKEPVLDWTLSSLMQINTFK